MQVSCHNLFKEYILEEELTHIGQILEKNVLRIHVLKRACFVSLPAYSMKAFTENLYRKCSKPLEIRVRCAFRTFCLEKW